MSAAREVRPSAADSCARFNASTGRICDEHAATEHLTCADGHEWCAWWSETYDACIAFVPVDGEPGGGHWCGKPPVKPYRGEDYRAPRKQKARAVAEDQPALFPDAVQDAAPQPFAVSVLQVTKTKRGRVSMPPLPKRLRIVREVLPTAEEVAVRVEIRSPADCARAMRPLYDPDVVEVFRILCLDTQNRVTDVVEVTRGILNGSLVHPREVFRAAIAAGAAGIVMAHNHPSGSTQPSADDRAVTTQLVAAGRILDIPVYDHVIIGDAGKYFSFAEAGLL